MRNKRNGITESRFEALLCLISPFKRILYHFSVLMVKLDV